MPEVFVRPFHPPDANGTQNRGEELSTTLAHVLQEVREGRTDRLGDLLDGCRNYLTILARVEIGRRLQGKLDAADLVQETFLEAHRGIGRFRGTSQAQFLYWLRQILAAKVANLVRHYLGTQSRDVRLEQDLVVHLDNSSRLLDGGLALSQTSPSQQVVQREQGLLLADALARLPEDYRDVLVLRHFEGLTFPQVAQRMNRTVDSVDKLWVRALAQLRTAFQGA